MHRKVIYFDKAPAEYVEALESVRPEGFILLYWDKMTEAEQKIALAEAEYCMVTSFRVKREVLEKALSMKMVQRTGVGVNNVDMVCADQLKIPVAIVPRGNGIAVAEHSILMVLALYRHLLEIDQKTKQGLWPNFEYRPTSYELEGKIHGFIGFGFIGKETAKRSKSFGTNIMYYDLLRASPEIEAELGATYGTIEKVLKKSDIVSLHVPYAAENHHMISMPQLMMMKKNSLLINCARGGLVNEEDLYTALTTGIIGGAGFDCWADEPVREVRPLFGLNNVIATPHAAAGTLDTFKKCVELSFDNIVKAEKTGTPDNVKGATKTTRFYK